MPKPSQNNADPVNKETAQKIDVADQSQDAATGTVSVTTSGLEHDIKDEKGGPNGPEPTRYGDWEIGGKCVDF